MSMRAQINNLNGVLFLSFFRCFYTRQSQESGNLIKCTARRVARNSQCGFVFGGLGVEPPAAGGQWGSGGKSPSCRRLGGVGRSPQQHSKILHFFAKLT